MKSCVYMSEVSPWWTIERQEAALADVPDSAVRYVDHLDEKQRRAHRPDMLVQRAAMLRATTRRVTGERFIVPSWAVLGWAWDDVAAVVQNIAERGGVLESKAEPGQSCTKETWQAARDKSRREGASRRGGAVTGARMSAIGMAAAKTIAPYWPLPSKEYPTAGLLERAGISLNTAKKYLGSRPIAQYNHRVKLAQAAARAARKEKRK